MLSFSRDLHDHLDLCLSTPIDILVFVELEGPACTSFLCSFKSRSGFKKSSEVVWLGCASRSTSRSPWASSGPN
jgi:hypothetical protein